MNENLETDELLLQFLAKETEFGPSKLQRRAKLSYNRAAEKIEAWLEAGRVRPAHDSPYRFVVCVAPTPGPDDRSRVASRGSPKAGGEAE
jgi:DNA segregation ATPase FtsK/SpoIIIE-like protein